MSIDRTNKLCLLMGSPGAGNQTVFKQFFPKAQYQQTGLGIYRDSLYFFVDVPGQFEDVNREIESKTRLMKLIEQASEVRFVLFVTEYDIMDVRLTRFRETINDLRRFFRDTQFEKQNNITRFGTVPKYDIAKKFIFVLTDVMEQDSNLMERMRYIGSVLGFAKTPVLISRSMPDNTLFRSLNNMLLKVQDSRTVLCNYVRLDEKACMVVLQKFLKIKKYAKFAVKKAIQLVLDNKRYEKLTEENLRIIKKSVPQFIRIGANKQTFELVFGNLLFQNQFKSLFEKELLPRLDEFESARRLFPNLYHLEQEFSLQAAILEGLDQIGKQLQTHIHDQLNKQRQKRQAYQLKLKESESQLVSLRNQRQIKHQEARQKQSMRENRARWAEPSR